MDRASGYTFAMLREKRDELKYDAYCFPDSHAFYVTHAQAAPMPLKWTHLNNKNVLNTAKSHELDWPMKWVNLMLDTWKSPGTYSVCCCYYYYLIIFLITLIRTLRSDWPKNTLLVWGELGKYHKRKFTSIHPIREHIVFHITKDYFIY